MADDQYVHAIDVARKNMYGEHQFTKCGLDIARNAPLRWVNGWWEKVTCPSCKKQVTAPASTS